MIIGITGPDRSGKTTLARLLSIWLDGLVVPFAATLKTTAARTYGPHALFKSAEGRKFLVELGLAGRKVALDCWINHVKAVQLVYKDKPIIVPDVRFLNEADFIKQQGGIVIKIIGDGNWFADTKAIQADIEVPFTFPPRQMAKLVCAKTLNLTEPKRNAFIYLSLPITLDPYGYNNMLEEWLSRLKRKLHHCTILHPGYYSKTRESEDYVSYDLKLISQSDAVVCAMVRPSIGCAMELLYAWLNEKLTICCSKIPGHKWLKQHCDFLLENNSRFILDLIRLLNDWIIPVD